MNLLVNERKFTAHSLDTDRALTLIGHYCSPDPVYPRGTVHSIYFDTLHLACFQEKIEGDCYKRKYRLRWYDVPGEESQSSTRAFFEIKYRYGSARDKLRQEVCLPRSWIAGVPLTDPEISRRLRLQASPATDNFPLDLVPALCISYHRHRFVCNRSGLTVCVDSLIRASRINPEVFAATVPFDLQTVVCEMKSPGFVDIPWAKWLYHSGFRIRSFSKYGECINQILHGGAPTVIRMSI